MRKFCSLTCSTLIITALLIISTNAMAAEYPQTSIRFSGGIWDVKDSDAGITVHHTDLGNDERFTDVQVSGVSGAIAFSHMMGKRFAWELSLGGFSDTKSQTYSRVVDTRYGGEHYDTISSNTHSVSVSYMTVGLIYYPLYELEDKFGSLSSFLRPYITAGIGPYFGWEAVWDDNSNTDANVATAMGAYPGIGLDIMLSRHFIFNIDLRYHLVEFSEALNEREDYSGLNAVGGFKIAF